MSELKRKLAAIMFTDIVGYTALMGSDEDKAFGVLRKNREIHIKFIEQFNGTLIKEMGDGMLVQFSSAADSVSCAIEIQQQASKELEAKVRIGIHLGDITVENNDVFGDGVNIASRIQSIADPGGIYISESVQKSIRSKTDIPTKYLGEFILKNVSYKVKIYAVIGNGLAEPSDARIKQLKGHSRRMRLLKSLPIYVLLIAIMVGVWWTRNKPINDNLNIASLMVLPLDNFTGSDSLEYFVAGMHTSLIGDIGKIGSLKVRSKTTSKAYKDTNMSIPEIAAEQNVDAIVEASVMCLGDTVCFHVEVVSAFPEEKQLWRQDYRVEKSQILNLYSTVTKEIAKEIGIMLTPEEDRLLTKSRTVDEEVYDLYLKASYTGDLSRESLYKSLDYLHSAIDKDPDWAPLYEALATTWAYINQVGYEPVSVTFPEIYKNLYKALELDPNLSDVHRGLALIAYLVEWDWEKGENEFLKALAINPNDAMTRALYGQLLCNLQRNDEAIAQARLALELDPLSPDIKGWSGAIFFGVGDFKTALALAEEITAANPRDMMGNTLLEVSAFHCKEYDKMMKAWRYILPGVFNFTEKDIKEIEIVFNEQGYLAAYDIILIHLEEYAEKNYISGISIAQTYIMANQPDKAMDWLEKGFEQKDPKVPNITSIFYFEPLFDNPRFIAICKKMNLPLSKN